MRGRAMAIIAVLAVDCGLLTPDASASTKTWTIGYLEYAKSTISLPPHQESDLVTFCPNGRDVGGGGAVTGPSPSFSSSHIASSDPYDFPVLDPDTDPDDGWHSAVYNGTNRRQTGSTYVICWTNFQASNLDYHSSLFLISSNGTVGDMTAPCPAGEAVFGGGFFGQPPSQQIVISASQPTAAEDGWMFSATNVDTINTRGFDAYSICGTHYGTFISQRLARAVPAKSTATLRVSCPANLHVISGGASEASYLISTRPFDGKDADTAPDDGWEARVRNLTIDPLDASVYAFCM